MANYVALLGDQSDHGGSIVSVTQSVAKINGIDIACVGDMHHCPQKGHGTTALAGGASTKAKIKGNAIAMTGTTAGCGAKIITSQTKVKIS